MSYEYLYIWDENNNFKGHISSSSKCIPINRSSTLKIALFQNTCYSIKSSIWYKMYFTIIDNMKLFSNKLRKNVLYSFHWD